MRLQLLCNTCLSLNQEADFKLGIELELVGIRSSDFSIDLLNSFYSRYRPICFKGV